MTYKRASQDLVQNLVVLSKGDNILFCEVARRQSSDERLRSTQFMPHDLNCLKVKSAYRRPSSIEQVARYLAFKSKSLSTEA